MQFFAMFRGRRALADQSEALYGFYVIMSQQVQHWRSRIIGHGEEAPDQLLANPRNWRIHPKAQQDALTDALDQVGWVQDIIVNQRTGHVIDGHLRISLAISQQEKTVPMEEERNG